MDLSLSTCTVKFDRASLFKYLDIFCNRATVVIYNKTSWNCIIDGDKESEKSEFNRYVPVTNRECQLYAIPESTNVFNCVEVPFYLFWIVLRNTVLGRSRLVYSKYNVAGFDFDLSVQEEDDFISELNTELTKYLRMRPEVALKRIEETDDAFYECTFTLVFSNGSNEPGSIGL